MQGCFRGAIWWTQLNFSARYRIYGFLRWRAGQEPSWLTEAFRRYEGGTITPKILPMLREGAFMSAFVDKGRMRNAY
jgi:hypothetical protein